MSALNFAIAGRTKWPPLTAFFFFSFSDSVTFTNCLFCVSHWRICMPNCLSAFPSAYLYTHLLIYMPFCWSVCPSDYLYALLLICMPIWFSVCPSDYLFAHLLICMPICWSVYPSADLYDHLIICMPICLSVCPSAYLFVHLLICMPICWSGRTSGLSSENKNKAKGRLKKTPNWNFPIGVSPTLPIGKQKLKNN